MSKTTDNVTELVQRTQAACRVAYTLNSTQPVQCTIIGDEPLFFMSYEADLAADEDAAFDEAFGFDAIEQGIAELHEKIMQMDRMAESLSGSGSAIMSQFQEDADFITQPSAPETGDIEDLKIALRQSRLAASYMDFALRFKTTLSYSREAVAAVYDRHNNAIFINPDRTPGEQLLLAARELRRLWQHRNGALLHPLMFHPEQAILVNRAQIADLSVSMVRIAWELQLANDPAAWERLENSSMQDLAHAFARESALDFRTLNNGAAQSAVFEAWFLSERCRHEDRKLIQQMLADYHGYVFESGQPPQSVTHELIGALGSMPFGKNYLAPFVATIAQDSIFTEVRDRSNANFLWFIKFERSFRETEHDLHGDNAVRHRDITHGDSQINNKDGRNGHNEKTANIIALPGNGKAPPPAARKRRAGSGGGGNVISFIPERTPS